MMTQSEYRRLKGRLTRRENALKAAQANVRLNPNNAAGYALVCEAARNLRDEARNALDIFEDQGYPDAWHRWQRANDDATTAIHRYYQR